MSALGAKSSQVSMTPTNVDNTSAPTIEQTLPSIASADSQAIHLAVERLGWLSTEERGAIVDALTHRQMGNVFGPAVAAAMNRCAGGVPASQQEADREGLSPFIAAALLHAYHVVDFNEQRREAWMTVGRNLETLNVDRIARLIVGVMYGDKPTCHSTTLPHVARTFGISIEVAKASHDAALRALYDGCCAPE